MEMKVVINVIGAAAFVVIAFASSYAVAGNDRCHAILADPAGHSKATVKRCHELIYGK